MVFLVRKILMLKKSNHDFIMFIKIEIQDSEGQIQIQAKLNYSCVAHHFGLISGTF